MKFSAFFAAAAQVFGVLYILGVFDRAGTFAIFLLLTAIECALLEMLKKKT